MSHAAHRDPHDILVRTYARLDVLDAVGTAAEQQHAGLLLRALDTIGTAHGADDPRYADGDSGLAAAMLVELSDDIAAGRHGVLPATVTAAAGVTVEP